MASKTRNPRKTKREGAEQSEEAFLSGYDPSAFERPSVAVDVVLLCADSGALLTLVLPRATHPHRGRWALPGGFVRMDESLDAAARRVLVEKAGLSGVFLEQLYTFGAVERDPRTRVVSVAYYALVHHERFTGLQDRVARVDVPWEGETGGAVDLRAEDGSPLALAFDHADIVGTAVKRIRGKLGYTPIGYQLLPERFTLRDLQTVHETVLGRPLNKDSFRRRMLASGELEATGERQTDVDHRPAELYRMSRRSAV
jgi:8-oxo-dGTP diphosphatase